MINSQTFEIFFADEDTKTALVSSGASLDELILACYVAVDAEGEPVCAGLTAEVLGDGQCLVQVTEADRVVFLKFDPTGDLLDDVLPEEMDDATADRLVELMNQGTAAVPKIARYFWERAEDCALEIDGTFIRHIQPEMSLEDAAFSDPDDDFLVVYGADGEADAIFSVKDALMVRPSDSNFSKVGDEPVAWTLSDKSTELFAVTKAA